MTATNWNSEYKKQGLPSSYKDNPSTVVRWAMKNIEFLIPSFKQNQTLNIVDVGCGKARNAIYYSSLGHNIYCFDASSTAIKLAKIAIEKTNSQNIEIELRNLTVGIPKGDETQDVLSDIFVFKHQTDIKTRIKYIKEVRRVLKPQGVFILSLADKTDGYYSQCPKISCGNELLTVNDPSVNIDSVLYDLEELKQELGNTFSLQMVWKKYKKNFMHGKVFPRVTLCTVWKKYNP